MDPTSPVATSQSLAFIDQRTIRPELAPYERGEVEQAVTLLNTILRRKINLCEPLSQPHAMCCASVIVTLREVRRTAVQFGAHRAADLVAESTSIGQARQKIARYVHGRNAEDHE